MRNQHVTSILGPVIQIGGFVLLLLVLHLGSPPDANGQAPHCDPKQVLTAESCAKCHAQADAVWKRTPHFTTYETLHRRPEAKEIARRMGIQSIKRGDLCVNCHYTQIEKEGSRLKAVSGVSCESCHGAGKNWVNIHNDYGGPGVTKAQETAAHAQMRWKVSTEQGMRNPRNLYLMAKSCLGCHTVPNEKLVNVGGHKAGSLEFEFVTWSQGTIRHNFLRTGGNSNAVSDDARLRVMWVAGLIADLELSTRATAAATEKRLYGLTVAKRAAALATRLYEIQQRISHPQLEKVLVAFSEAELKINNSRQLNEIADRIGTAGMEFARTENGSNLSAIAELVPLKSSFR